MKKHWEGDEEKGVYLNESYKTIPTIYPVETPSLPTIRTRKITHKTNFSVFLSHTVACFSEKEKLSSIFEELKLYQFKKCPIRCHAMCFIVAKHIVTEL